MLHTFIIAGPNAATPEADVKDLDKTGSHPSLRKNQMETKTGEILATITH
jgi:hypothetical protein